MCGEQTAATSARPAKAHEADVTGRLEPTIKVVREATTAAVIEATMVAATEATTVVAATEATTVVALTSTSGLLRRIHGPRRRQHHI